jgi:hypothetical protein
VAAQAALARVHREAVEEGRKGRAARKNAAGKRSGQAAK